MTLPFINFLVFSGAFFIYLMTSSVGTSGIGPKIIPTEMIRPSVIPARNLRSIARQKRSQRSLIFVRSQNIVCWKLSRGRHFGSNGPICIFNFAFFVHRFPSMKFLFLISFFNFLISLFIFFFYLFFLIGSKGPPYWRLSIHPENIRKLELLDIDCKIY